MNQRIVSSRFPYLPIRIRVRDHDESGEALLDTGFDGGIVVPQGFFADEEQPDWYVWWTVADERRVLAPIYSGTIELDGFGPFQTLVTALGDEMLVGLQVASRFSILLDHGVQVIVEP